MTFSLTGSQTVKVLPLLSSLITVIHEFNISKSKFESNPKPITDSEDDYFLILFFVSDSYI